MSIQERKTKTGISFRITAYDGYKVITIFKQLLTFTLMS